MSRYLIYTAPGSGHLYPLIPTIEELRRRGHGVVVYAEERNLPLLNRLNIPARPINPAIEARDDDTWRAHTPIGGMRRSVQMYLDRAPHEVGDLRAVLGDHRPDIVIVDSSCWGAAALLHETGLPWAQAAMFLLPLMTPDAPPFGLGLKPSSTFVARIRDGLLRALVTPMLDRMLPPINELRDQLGAPPVRHMPDLFMQAPLVLSYTAQPLEYLRRHLPERVLMVGPGSWDPAEHHPEPDWFAHLQRPVILVTGSSQHRNDAKLIQTALDALANSPFDVVATTASIDPSQFRRPNNAHVERYLPHSIILRRTVAVVCHGGMGTTQKALLAGVPVCVVPSDRDQREVARRVDVAKAGARLAAFRLSRHRLRTAITLTMARKAGAERAAQMLTAAGGAPAAATALENLVDSGIHTRRP